ncbi:nucleotide sugar dehydrogenase [Geojedonia litorea]|uniref:Nucleotide sugar dehydrogenase n=1 Tax=Geojedonia litorea TaxID=1268269 RepID=A0ABV9N5X8_9FLAO
MKTEKNIAVIGLGYVGLPLAVEFAKKGFNILGFDINHTRVAQLKDGIDVTNEVSFEELKEAKSLQFTTNEDCLTSINIFIVTVPTPIDKYKKPNLHPLKSASKLVGKHLKLGSIVIYESTVFPGCTEDVCVPILENESGLKFNKDFFCGYSPERINPGDKTHRVSSIMKVTSGSTPEIAEEIDLLYKEIIIAGTYKASSLKVAEAAKVIENTQRDLNIAFVNELALIFEKLNIDTKEVLEAAGTKWNFLKFFPGLVGGHCIGVDPYYLTHKAQSIGYNPEVILAGRRINDNMGKHVAKRYVKLLLHSNKIVREFKTLILGFTFKENCPDIRNTRVIDIYNELLDFGIKADIYDPLANKDEIKEEYNISVKSEDINSYHGIIIAVGHEEFFTYDWENIVPNKIVFDIKSILPSGMATDRL